jgi:hypothetical protein
MKRWIILAVLAFILTVSGALAVLSVPDSVPEPSVPVRRQSEGPPPKLELVGQPVYDFGTMSQHSKGVHSWQIKNVGQGVLEIWLLETTCSCTVATLQAEVGQEGSTKKTVVVQPGQSTPIDVSWDTKAWKRFAHSAMLGTNDPTNPSFTLAVRGKVVPHVAVDPEQVGFPTFSNEETRQAKLSLFSADRADLKLVKVSTSKPGLLVAHTTPMTPAEAKLLKVETGYHLTVEIKPGMPPGGFREEVVIQTDHPRQPEVRVAVTGHVSGPISAVPERLRMPNVTSRDGASREVTLLVRGGRQTHFEVAHKPEKVEVAIEPDDTPTMKGRYRMTVKVPAGTAAGPVNDQIILRTDHPNFSELGIPVSIFISRSRPG